MNKIIAIVNKDLISYFKSLPFYSIGFFYCLVAQLNYFYDLNKYIGKVTSGVLFGSQESHILFGLYNNNFNVLFLLFLIILPSLSSKFISDEKKENTIQLLFTNPINNFHIVLGKFIAGFIALLFLWFIGSFLPLTTALFTNSNPILIVNAFLGFLLFLIFNLSICLLCSSTTGSTLLSSVLSFFAIVTTMFLPGALNTQFFNGNIPILNQLSTINHLMPYLNGKFEVNSFVFLITGIALTLYLTKKSLDAQQI